MQSTITKALQELERQKGISILYACESGSRAWGFPSPDSDYDVRVIYIHPKEWYLSIDDLKKTVELPVSGDLDISGWDIRKALRIFCKSNASIFEWLQSPIVYQSRTDFARQLRELMPQYFSPRAVMHHHLGIVYKIYGEAREEPEVKLKKYFYILRSLLSAIWVREYQTLPPMEFKSLITLLPHESDIFTKVQLLWQMKATADEKTTIPSIKSLHQFIEEELMACETSASTVAVSKNNTEKLNQLFRKILEQLPLQE